MAKLNQSMDVSNFTPEQMEMAAKAIKNAKDITCKCGCSIFTQGAKIKQLSRLLTGSNKDEIIPIPTLFCVKCFSEIDLVDNKESPIIQ
jgi:hypothetical protein